MTRRLDQYREQVLQPKRVQVCMDKLFWAGFDPKCLNEYEVTFQFKGNTIRLFPYSGWHSGKGIKDGRGFKRLLEQIGVTDNLVPPKYVRLNDTLMCLEDRHYRCGYGGWTIGFRMEGGKTFSVATCSNTESLHDIEMTPVTGQEWDEP